VTLWSGAYLGLQGGFARDTASFTAPGETVPFGEIDLEGWFAGARFGMDHQSGNFVFGVLGDINFGDVNADVINLGGGGSDVHAEMDWMGTLRVRAGVAMNQILLYASGGLAFGHVEATVTDLSGGGLADSGTDSATHTGWTAGLGAEVAVNDRVSLFGEWLYTDYGSQSYHFENPTDPTSFIDADTSITGNSFMAGVNLRFR
jgi:outer membrane immunogenic protein